MENLNKVNVIEIEVKDQVDINGGLLIEFLVGVAASAVVAYASFFFQEGVNDARK